MKELIKGFVKSDIDLLYSIVQQLWLFFEPSSFKILIVSREFVQLIKSNGTQTDFNSIFDRTTSLRCRCQLKLTEVTCQRFVLFAWFPMEAKFRVNRGNDFFRRRRKEFESDLTEQIGFVTLIPSDRNWHPPEKWNYHEIWSLRYI